jgi:hypothetical protein
MSFTVRLVYPAERSVPSTHWTGGSLGRSDGLDAE